MSGAVKRTNLERRTSTPASSEPRRAAPTEGPLLSEPNEQDTEIQQVSSVYSSMGHVGISSYPPLALSLPPNPSAVPPLNPLSTSSSCSSVTSSENPTSRSSSVPSSPLSPTTPPLASSSVSSSTSFNLPAPVATGYQISPVTSRQPFTPRLRQSLSVSSMAPSLATLHFLPPLPPPLASSSSTISCCSVGDQCQSRPSLSMESLRLTTKARSLSPSPSPAFSRPTSLPRPLSPPPHTRFRPRSAESTPDNSSPTSPSSTRRQSPFQRSARALSPRPPLPLPPSHNQAPQMPRRRRSECMTSSSKMRSR